MSGPLVCAFDVVRGVGQAGTTARDLIPVSPIRFG
jgi:hypothetical protein